jgi:hypothetical protein
LDHLKLYAVVRIIDGAIDRVWCERQIEQGRQEIVIRRRDVRVTRELDLAFELADHKTDWGYGFGLDGG